MAAFTNTTNQEALWIKSTAKGGILLFELFDININAAVNAKAGEMINVSYWLDGAAVMAKQGTRRNWFLA
jgi:hypothetical protein